MKNYIFHIIFVFYYLTHIAYTNALTINIAGQAFLQSFHELYPLITREFNQHAIEIDKDIYLNFTLFSSENITNTWDSFDSYMDSLLSKKNQKYDVIIYDPVYTRRYSPYFVDLNDWLPQNHLKKYVGDSEKIGKYKNKWVGLPLLLKYTVLYSNTVLLEKYGKSIPKTWDELMETAEYILKEENDDTLVGYNGYFPKTESAMCTLYSYLYSLREEKESAFPDFTSKISEDGLNFLKQMKEKISSDQVFASEEEYNMKLLNEGKVIFSNFWDVDHNIPNYKMSLLPGRKKNINGSCVGGFLLGINKYISDEKKSAAAEVIKFFTSDYVQKDTITKYFQSFTGLTKLYDDRDTCSVFECGLAKNFQSIERPSSLISDYNSYSKEVTKLITDFLYNGKQASNTLQDITKLMSELGLSMDDSPFSLGMFLGLIALFVFVIAVFAVIYISKHRKYLSFFNLDLWIVYLSGILLTISSGFAFFGYITAARCYINHILFTLGLTLAYSSLLYNLIVNVPLINKYSEWVRRNKWILICSLIFIDFLTYCLFIISPYQVDSPSYSRTFYSDKCKMKDESNKKILFSIHIGYKIILFMALLMFIYLEWNMESSYYDLRVLTLSLFFNGMGFCFYVASKFIEINIYSVFFIIIIVIGATNFVNLLVLKIFTDKLNLKIESNLEHANKIRRFTEINGGATNTMNSFERGYAASISVVSTNSQRESENPNPNINKECKNIRPKSVMTNNTTTSSAFSFTTIKTCHYASNHYS